MPAVGLTSSLIAKRKKQGGSATSNVTLSHYASGPISHTTSVPGGAVSTPYPTSTVSSTPSVPSAAASRAAAKAQAAEQARQQAVKGLAKAQTQIKKLANQKVKVARPPKLQNLKQPSTVKKFAKSLGLQAEKNSTPAPVDRQLIKAQVHVKKAIPALKKAVLPPKAPLRKQVANLSPRQKVVFRNELKPKPQKASAAKLTKSAPKKGGHPYVYPFSKGITIGRTDMGIDPVGTGKVRAIGKAKVIGIGGSGWPDEQGTTGSGQGPVYKLLKGPLAGKKVYTYEGVQSNVKPGDVLKKGQVFAKSTADFETGFAQGKKGGFQPIALKAGQPPLPADHANTQAGQKFAAFVAKTAKGGSFKSANTVKVSAKVPTYVPKAYQADVARAAKKYKVPAGILAAQLRQESGFNPSIGSPAGAQGIAQFMPGTASSAGPHGTPINPDNPSQAIDAQGRLMAKNLKEFGGHMDLALAAYNAGSGAVSAAGNQVPNIPETQAYVKTILGAASGSGATVRVSASGAPSFGSTTSGTTGAVTSGTTSTSTGAAPTSSSGTSNAAVNRARLLREVNKNRKKAAAKIGSYRQGLTPPPASAPAPTSTAPSSGSIRLGL